jgi:hypothetical protein
LGTERPDIRDGIFRQRRALLAASSVLLLYVAAGIRIEELSVLGTKVHVERPGLVPLALWILWAYFLIRYFQYFHDLKDRGFRDAYTERLELLIQAMAVRKLQCEFRPPGIEPAEYLPPYRFELEAVELLSRGPGEWRVRAAGGVNWRTPRGFARQDFHNYQMDIGPWELLLPRIRSACHVATKTRLGTEYMLPFFVAVAPLAYVIYDWVSKR